MLNDAGMLRPGHADAGCNGDGGAIANGLRGDVYRAGFSNDNALVGTGFCFCSDIALGVSGTYLFGSCATGWPDLAASSPAATPFSHPFE